MVFHRLQAVLGDVAEGIDLALQLADAFLQRTRREEGLLSFSRNLAEHALVEPLADHATSHDQSDIAIRMTNTPLPT